MRKKKSNRNKKVKSVRKRKRKLSPRWVHGVNQRTGATRKGPNEDAL